MDLLRDLNPRQKEAVVHAGGPLLVLAGAGTGKTRVLAYRIAYLVSAARVYPRQILAVTFTNKAAGEMAERVRGLVGNLAAGMWMGTFHSICARILRIEGRLLGISPNFSIYDERDQLSLMKQLLADLGMTQSKLTPAAVLSRISWAKSNLWSSQDLADMGGNRYDQRIAAIYGAYDNALRAYNALDFDDLICMPVRLFKSSAETLERCSRRFHHILIDEYQDTNRAQYELVRLLSCQHRNICAVGDDDQSIYRWRGADVTNLLNFESDFPEAMVIRLEQSYRSTKTILAAAQDVIRQNRYRKDKALWTENAVGRKIVVAPVLDEHHEGEFIADSVVQAVREEGRHYSGFVVLYRTNAQSRSIEDALRRRGLPYVIVGGIKFYERKEIKDIMAYLRVLVNPRDSVSLARIINVPNRGIGQVTLARLRQFAEDQGVSMSEGLDRADEIAGLNAGAKMRLQAFRDLINLLRERSQKMRIAELITLVAEKSGYLEQLKALGTIEAVARTENIEELVASGYEFEERSEEPTLKRFLEEVSLVMDIDMWDDTREAVSLMTLHNAKGLEFPVVFIAGAEEGLLPHHTSFEDEQELEEERRLFYVGMTRAKEHLIISLASGRRGFRGWMPQVASRFLDSLPQGLVEVLMPAGDSCQQGDRHLDDGEEKLVTIGARVRHPEWGLGTVTGCEGYGRELRLTVRFGRGITKKVMACYARLEILDDD